MKIYNVERKEAYDPDTEPSKIDDDDLQSLKTEMVSLCL